MTLSIFPGLLDFAFTGPTILRLGLAITTIVLIYQAKNRDGFSWIALLASILILVGYLTQIVALVLGIIYALSLFNMVKHGALPSTKMGSILAVCIALSFLVTGAGAFAIDWPL
jgi:uncharacterized membrane protein YphA (DoxX/SURF4 family)